jgi:chromosome segregation ATPase
MSRFSAAQRDEILDQSRELLRRTAHIGGQQHREVEIIYKRRDDALVDHAPSERSTSAGSELSWAEWVDQRIAACLEPLYESVGTAMGEYVGQQVAALKRQIELLEREVTQLREQVGLERGLRDLRTEVEVARAAVPKVPALVEKLERGQERLQRELERTKKRVSRARADNSMADFKLNELRKATERRATEIQMKLETSVASFTMREVHPDAKAALRNFADEALKGHRGEKIWIFDPGPRAGTA